MTLLSKILATNKTQNTFYFTCIILLVKVKCTHPSNERSQDNIIMFQDPLVLQGLKMKQEKHTVILIVLN